MTQTFTDTRPLGARPEWIGGINYSITHDQTGYHVLAAYSYSTGRYIMPGETVHVCDEWGYWRKEVPVTFVGRSATSDFYFTADAAGQVHAVSSRVIHDVIPAERIEQ